MRSGIVAEKIGMTRFFYENGRDVPVTLLKVDKCTVLQKITKEERGYSAILLGYGDIKRQRANKSHLGFFAKKKINPTKRLKEFRVSDENFIDLNTVIKADHFQVGQFVDVIGTSKGKGFAGAMKRHNFAGLRASHGVSVSHRAHGSTGQCQFPGKVFKGKKMAGHLGNVRTTVQNLVVVDINVDEGIIAVKGALPGSNGSQVIVRDSVKKIGIVDQSMDQTDQAPQKNVEDQKETEGKKEEKDPTAVKAENAPKDLKVSNTDQGKTDKSTPTAKQG